MSGAAVNLGLVLKRGSTGIEDLTKLASYVRELCDDVRPAIVRDRAQPLRCLWLARRPTLVFSPGPVRRLRLRRGVVLCGRPRAKSEEYRALEAHGLPVPRWLLESRATAAGLSKLGKYVVVKPNRGRRGANVRIKRRARVRPAAGRPLPEDEDRIVQEFVWTGPWPVSYRVTTLLGEVLWCVRIEADRARTPLEGPEAFGALRQGVSIVSSGGGCRISLACDPEVLDLGRRVHAAFPDVPVLGVDIVRDGGSGALQVLEANSAGAVWSFSTRRGRQVQEQFGFRLEDQFDGLHLAARILVGEARRRAC
jgi:hypothetical protein